MTKKLSNKKGFTLAELLIVVAIIGILVAISVPIFTTQLAKARRATNQSNGRAALSAANNQYLAEGNGAGNMYYTYDVKAGSVGTGTSTAPSSGTGAVDYGSTQISTFYVHIGTNNDATVYPQDSNTSGGWNTTGSTTNSGS